METTSAAPREPVDALTQAKLDAFDGLEREFLECFALVDDAQGRRRFAQFPVALTVNYLHALWVCELKDRLLSVSKTLPRYDGQRCLLLLRGWQQGETADVIDFLTEKLGAQPFAPLTRQIEAARARGDEPLAQRLLHGRASLLTRARTLDAALDGVFALAPDELLAQTRAACAQFGHTPEQIAQQLTELDTPLYSYAPHPLLAQRNMLVMNRLGQGVLDEPADAPGERTSAVEPSTSPLPAPAEETIPNELDLSPPWHNNPAGAELATPPLGADAPELVDSSEATEATETVE